MGFLLQGPVINQYVVSYEDSNHQGLWPSKWRKHFCKVVWMRRLGDIFLYSSLRLSSYEGATHQGMWPCMCGKLLGNIVWMRRLGDMFLFSSLRLSSPLLPQYQAIKQSSGWKANILPNRPLDGSQRELSSVSCLFIAFYCN